jgi:hypothetical protein
MCGVVRPDAQLPAPEEGEAMVGAKTVSNAGVMTGLLGSAFALVSVLTLGLLFLPFAALFSALSVVRSISSLSLKGSILAIASCALTTIGLATSPEATRAVQDLFDEVAGSPPAPAESGQTGEAATSVARTGDSPQVSVVPSAALATPPRQLGSLPLPPLPPRTEPATSLKDEPQLGPQVGPQPSSRPMDPESSDGKQQSSEDKSPDALQGNASAADGSVPPPVVTLPSPPAEEPKAAVAEPKAAVAEPKPAVAEPKPAVAEPKPAVEEPKPALADDAPKSDLKPWPSNKTDQTREIQILLRDLDLYHGTTNGTLGPATRAAIRQFQLTNGDADTGEPTEELFDVLQKKRALMPIDRTQK